MLTGTITSHHGHHRLGIGYRHPQQIGHLSHDLRTTNRTGQSVDAAGVSPFHEGVGHTATARESTSAAVRTRQHLADLGNAGIFIDSKLLGGGKQNDSGYQSDGSQDNYCNQDEIHKALLFVLVCYLFQIECQLPTDTVTAEIENNIIWYESCQTADSRETFVARQQQHHHQYTHQHQERNPKS